MKERNLLIVCLLVVSILLTVVLVSYTPELSHMIPVLQPVDETLSIVQDTQEGFTTTTPIAYTRYNTPGSPRYPKPGEELTNVEKNTAQCYAKNRATPATNGIEIPYDGDRRYSSTAYQRGQYEEKGLVPKGFKDNLSVNACKLGGMQGALPEGSPCLVKIGGKYLAYSKKNNMAIMTDNKDNELCKMILHYPSFAFMTNFLNGDRDQIMFENRDGNYLTCGVPWDYGWDMSYYIHMNPEQSLKHFGLRFHPYFSPRRDQWATKDDVNKWLAIPETTETYQIHLDRSDPNAVRAFGEAADRKYFMGPWKAGTAYWNNKNAKTNPMGQIFGWAGADAAAGPYSKLFPLTALFPWGAGVPNQGTDTYLRSGSWNDWNNTTPFEILSITHEVMVPTLSDD
jgi:hypothetical protein